MFWRARARTGRGVLTVKAVALSALFVGVVVLTVIKRRRELVRMLLRGIDWAPLVR